MNLLKLKIGRHIYNITTKDEFMFDGYHTWLISQSKEPIILNGIRPDPRLSKSEDKEIELFRKVDMSMRNIEPLIEICFKLEKFPRKETS